ncbi:MAG: DnaA regulatory inactivator Hda [Burkholderiales bacterium]
MKQLALGLALDAAMGLEASVVGGNAELLSALWSVCLDDPGERLVYLWGVPGSGRSHLLNAAARTAAEAGRPVVRFDGDSRHDPCALVLADDVDGLDGPEQIALFNLINAQRSDGGALIAAGPVPPGELALRPDLRTRLAWGLVYQVQPLDDEDKVLALSRHAQARGFRMPEEVANYLLRHGQRDLRSLILALDRLDRRSIEQHRPLTIPLLREVLDAADS